MTAVETVTFSSVLPITDANGNPVKFYKVVPIADADGRPIRVASVLREINDGERGVVMRIIKAGERATSILDSVGDMQICVARGTTRCSNRYNQWRHIPHAEQTYKERLRSWFKTPYERSVLQSESISDDEAMAVSGIMALLPSDVVDWNFGPFPDRLEDALQFLADHLTDLAVLAVPAVVTQP